uniref:Uncharacterized protein n=1 Tax=Arundo donax TaxID=35708 RepID=A0A0A9CFX6_ARUDO
MRCITIVEGKSCQIIVQDKEPTAVARSIFIEHDITILHISHQSFKHVL